MSLRCAGPLVDYRLLRNPDSEGTTIPFSEERPLLFHVMTGLNSGPRGENDLMWMVKQGAALIPVDQSTRRPSLIMEHDRAAGDGGYLFLTPLTTYTTPYSSATYFQPALAFDAIALWEASQHGFAFRVRDLEPFYLSVQPTEVNELYPPDVNEEELSESEQLVYYRAALADAARDDLGCIADAGTIWDKDDALDVLSIYTMLVAGRITEQQAYEAALPLLPEQQLKMYDDYCPKAAEQFPDGLTDNWRELFESTDEDILFHLFRRRDALRPEVLYSGPIPLCCAALYRTSNGEWVRLPSDLCRVGARNWGRTKR